MRGPLTWWRRRGHASLTPMLAALAVALMTQCVVAPPSPNSPAATVTAPRAAPAPALAKGEPAWVAVTVATLWRSPSSPRKVDGPALARPARISAWLSAMTLAQRRALNGRADTQALLGDRVIVLRLRPGWAKVAVPDQPTPQLKRGYPGWVPRRQLTPTPPAESQDRATVIDRLAWLRADEPGGARVLRISFGTRLPVLGTIGSWVRVATPAGVLRVRARAVSAHPAGTAALPATRSGVVASAKQFVGLPYLWAGRSGFGFDCSGLTSLVYRVHGRRIPRDAAPQSDAGTSVSSPRRGDLLFYDAGAGVHHVSMAVGGGLMVHSPHTGSTVQVTSTGASPYAEEYAGARRFVG